MVSASENAKGRLAIIAGSGLLPVYVADAARQAGENPVIIALTDEADRDWSAFDHANLGVGNFAGLEAMFRRHGVDRVVMSGGVARRPSWRQVHPTWRVIKEWPGQFELWLLLPSALFFREGTMPFCRWSYD